MKLVTLNIWGGQVGVPLLAYIRNHQDVDVFCLQEVYHNAGERVCDNDDPVNLQIFSDIAAQLPNHTGIFNPVVNGIYGIAFFISNKYNISSQGEIEIHKNDDYVGKGPTHKRNLHWVKIEAHGKTFVAMNVHGLWNGKGKSDSDARLVQSRNIKGFLDSVPEPKILCGDFNLTPDTESIRMLECDGFMTNHITRNNIQDTRTSHYPKPIRHADYIFTSPKVAVNQFRVMPDEVSDHAPLYLEFGISE